MKALRWVGDYWYIPVLVIFSILGWVIFRRRGTPIEQTQAELEAIEAGRKARELAERLGTIEAHREVEKQYAKELDALDVEQKAKAKELERDPQALARFLVRAGRRK